MLLGRTTVEHRERPGLKMGMPMKPFNAAAWALAGCVMVASGAAAQAQTSAPANVSRPAPMLSEARPSTSSLRSHYIEFRVAEIGTYGHSYVAYGRLDARGKPADAHYADLHPMGNYLIMAVGHLLPVPANTEWDPDVLKLPIASSYFRPLNAADYAKLQTALRRARENKQPYWNAVTNNCNHFVAELARAIGLRTPNDFQLSYAFVPALRQLNESGDIHARSQRGGPVGRRAPASSTALPDS